MENKKMMDIELENVTGGANAFDDYYLVKTGDTLGDIANRYHTTVAELMYINPRITNANVIYAGEVIRIR